MAKIIERFFVKVKHSFQHGGQNIAPGTVLEVTKSQCYQYVGDGKAVQVSEDEYNASVAKVTMKNEDKGEADQQGTEQQPPVQQSTPEEKKKGK